MAELGDYVKHAMDSLYSMGIDAALAGGLAHNLWVGSGGQFDTEDIDLAVLVIPGQEISTAQLANELARRSGEECEFWDRYRRVDRVIYKFNCFSSQKGKESGTKLDLVLVYSDYAEEALKYAGTFEIGKDNYKILNPEDVILYKGLARRKKDVIKIAAMAEIIKLDMNYIEQWARALGRWTYVKAALEGEFRE